MEVLILYDCYIIFKEDCILLVGDYVICKNVFKTCTFYDLNLWLYF